MVTPWLLCRQEIVLVWQEAGNLTWNAHVDATRKKANNSLGISMKNLSNCVTSILQLEAVQRRSGICATGGLQDYYYHQSYDQKSWLGISATQENNGQDGGNVSCHTSCVRHSSTHVSTPLDARYKKPQTTLPRPLLQNRLIHALFLPNWYPNVELVARVRSRILDFRKRQVRVDIVYSHHIHNATMLQVVLWTYKEQQAAEEVGHCNLSVTSSLKRLFTKNS